MKLSQAIQITTAAVAAQMDALARGQWREADMIIAYMEGAPGLGKTQSKRQVAAALGLNYVSLIGSQYDPAELAGWALPVDGTEKMKRSEPDWWPDGSTPTLLDLDELPQSTTAVQNIFAQLVNERRIGKRQLPDNVVITASGNRLSDKAGTSAIPTHLRDRLMFLPVEADLEDVIAYLQRNNADERICGYLRARPEFLHKFDRDQTACPSPRSWDRVNTILTRFSVDPLCMSYSIAGQVGVEAAADFQTYLKVTAQMPDIDGIIANPRGSQIPANMSILHAVCAALSKRMHDGNAQNIIEYMKRLPQQEFAAFIIKDAINRDPELKKSNAVRGWVLSDGKALIL
jgi:hypothetical protein